MKDDIKLRWQIIAAVAMCVVGAGLIIAGFIVNPLGEIHPSVLTALGELLTFSGSLFGINARYKIKVNEYQSQQSTDNKEDMEE